MSCLCVSFSSLLLIHQPLFPFQYNLVFVTTQSKKTRKFSPIIGTKITKKYGDKIHEVLVVNDGFSYEGTVYTSLSAIATKIMGTRWNGLKFFGVKK